MGEAQYLFYHERVGWHFSREAIAMGLRGRALWHAMLDFCQSNLTDGDISTDQMRMVVRMAGVTMKEAHRLVELGLLELHGDTFNMPRYLDDHRSRAKVEEIRANRRKAGIARAEKAEKAARAEQVLSKVTQHTVSDSVHDLASEVVHHRRGERPPSSRHLADAVRILDSNPGANPQNWAGDPELAEAIAVEKVRRSVPPRKQASSDAD